MSQKVQTIKREGMVGKLFLGGILVGKMLECLASCRTSYGMYLGTNLATLGTGFLLSSKIVVKIKKAVQG